MKNKNNYDYLLADKTIIPNGSEHFYSEKIAYLPSYQVNDRKRKIADKKLGLLVNFNEEILTKGIKRNVNNL